jgi:single-strand DNA-binding protein
LVKGDLVIIEGRVKQREWEKDGVKRTTAEVTADEVAKVVKAGWKAPAQEGSPDPWAAETAPF